MNVWMNGWMDVWLAGFKKRMLYNIHAPMVGSLLVCEQRAIVSNDCYWFLPCLLSLHAALYRSPATLPAEM
jgi:hypothetical protein